MQLKINFLCRDSILAAPIVLDTALYLDLAQRAGISGIQAVVLLQGADARAGSLLELKNTLRYVMGEELITHLGREYYD